MNERLQQPQDQKERLLRLVEIIVRDRIAEIRYDEVGLEENGGFNFDMLEAYDAYAKIFASLPDELPQLDEIDFHQENIAKAKAYIRIMVINGIAGGKNGLQLENELNNFTEAFMEYDRKELRIEAARQLLSRYGPINDDEYPGMKIVKGIVKEIISDRPPAYEIENFQYEDHAAIRALSSLVLRKTGEDIFYANAFFRALFMESKNRRTQDLQAVPQTLKNLASDYIANRLMQDYEFYEATEELGKLLNSAPPSSLQDNAISDISKNLINVITTDLIEDLEFREEIVKTLLEHGDIFAAFLALPEGDLDEKSIDIALEVLEAYIQRPHSQETDPSDLLNNIQSEKLLQTVEVYFKNNFDGQLNTSRGIGLLMRIRRIKMEGNFPGENDESSCFFPVKVGDPVQEYSAAKIAEKADESSDPSSFWEAVFRQISLIRDQQIRTDALRDIERACEKLSGKIVTIDLIKSCIKSPDIKRVSGEEDYCELSNIISHLLYRQDTTEAIQVFKKYINSREERKYSLYFPKKIATCAARKKDWQCLIEVLNIDGLSNQQKLEIILSIADTLDGFSQ